MSEDSGFSENSEKNFEILEGIWKCSEIDVGSDSELSLRFKSWNI